jgi:RHS repeat-associated protein
MLVDDFETEWLFGASVLPQWTHASGSGFLLYDGRLTHQSSSPSVLVNASDDVLVDGNAAVDVSFSDATAYGSLIVRYANSYYYAAEIHNDSLYLIKCCANTRVVATRAFQHVIPVNEEHRLQVKAESNTITVTLDGVYVLSWTDTGTGGDSPLTSGKVGFAHPGGGPTNGIQWDDIVVTSGIPGQVITAEDYDPWGVVMDNRSYVLGNPDQRYKFTGKERDAETGYDYFGARYYDARIGRLFTVDPLASGFPGGSSYAYALDNPLRLLDLTGKAPTDFLDRGGNLVAHYDDQLKSVFQQVGEKEFQYYEEKTADVSGKLNVTAVVAETQKLNEDNLYLRPHFAFNKAGEKYLETHCNFAVQNILSSLASAIPDMHVPIGTANVMQSGLSKSEYFAESGNWDKANDERLAGNLVIASWKNPNPEKSGHVAALAVHEVGLWGQVANIGKTNGVLSLSKSFGSQRLDAIKFFIFNYGR